MDYDFFCEACGWTGRRYANLKRCPKCHGDVIRTVKETRPRVILSPEEHAVYMAAKHNSDSMSIARAMTAVQVEADAMQRALEKIASHSYSPDTTPQEIAMNVLLSIGVVK